MKVSSSPQGRTGDECAGTPETPTLAELKAESNKLATINYAAQSR